MSTIYHGEGYVYAIQYHLVWCVKYRKSILNGEVETWLKDELRQIAKDNNAIIDELECNEDHIHMLFECSPQCELPSASDNTESQIKEYIQNQKKE
jgi:putative transposase